MYSFLSLMQFSVLVLGLCSRGTCLQWRFVVVFTPVIYQKKPLKRLWWLWAWRRWNLRGHLRNDQYIWCVTVKHCLPSKLVLLKYRYLKRTFRLLSLKDFPGSRTSVQPLAITLGSQDSLSSSSVARLRNPFLPRDYQDHWSAPGHNPRCFWSWKNVHKFAANAKHGKPIHEKKSSGASLKIGDTLPYLLMYCRLQQHQIAQNLFGNHSLDTLT